MHGKKLTVWRMKMITAELGKSWDKSGSQTVDLQVGGVILDRVLIDLGSSCNIIDQKTCEELVQKKSKVHVRKDKTEIVLLWNFRNTEHAGKV